MVSQGLLDFGLAIALLLVNNITVDDFSMFLLGVYIAKYTLAQSTPMLLYTDEVNMI